MKRQYNPYKMNTTIKQKRKEATIKGCQTFDGKPRSSATNGYIKNGLLFWSCWKMLQTSRWIR